MSTEEKIQPWRPKKDEVCRTRGDEKNGIPSLKARVVAIDMKGPLPVVALVEIEASEEAVWLFEADGRLDGGVTQPQDLVPALENLMRGEK